MDVDEISHYFSDSYYQDFSKFVYSLSKLVSASVGSQSISLSTKGFNSLMKFNVCDACDTEYLSTFLYPGLDHIAIRDNLIDHLNNLFQPLNLPYQTKRDEPITFATEPMRPLFVKRDIHPDILFNSLPSDKTFLIFDVHSTRKSSSIYSDDEHQNNIRHLGISLAKQLRCARQVNPNLLEMVGYYNVFSNYLFGSQQTY